MLFQAVPEPKAVKNRVHLDLLLGPEAHDAEVQRLTGLGATVVGSMTVRRVTGRFWPTPRATSSTSPDASSTASTTATLPSTTSYVRVVQP
ncbi:MAG: hypothetical protein M3Q48_11665 [Actinomycetota bacterium]|nr:hypothetical protein [Actinomycetota bacterium]